MASPPPPILGSQALSALTDELLEEIFLRVSTPTDLVRASVGCASFRRIITDRSFLRRFRAIHPPPLLGFIGVDDFHSAQPPHPSAPLVRALAHADDFFSFIPAGKWSTPWCTLDVRQGRVLLECSPEQVTSEYYDITDLGDFELVVCDPLFRRYVLLPPVPDELTAGHGRLVDFGAFLAPTGDDDEETSFRVICTAWNETRLFAFVFYSVTEQWNLAASPSWYSLGTDMPSSHHCSTCFDYAQGCFYLTALWRDKMLMLDSVRMDFSIINNDWSIYRASGHGQPCISVSAEGIPLMFFFGDLNENGSIDDIPRLHVTKLNDTRDQWELEKIIPLPKDYEFFTLGAAEDFLFLRGVPEEDHSTRHYFALEINTSELKRVCRMRRRFFRKKERKKCECTTDKEVT
ncbi:hypothetical protein EJB05_11824, partial [Eragrostis curvula]